MYRFDRTQKGQWPLPHELLNAMQEGIEGNSLFTGAGPVEAHSGPLGHHFRVAHPTMLAMFVVANDWTFPTHTSPENSKPSVPYTTGATMQAWFAPTADVPIPHGLKYDDDPNGETATLYFAACAVDASKIAVYQPTPSVGSRVVCWYNLRSARWELIYSHECFGGYEIRFRLDGTLAGSYASATLLDKDGAATSQTLTVYNPLGIFEGENGDKGYADWFPDASRFEIKQLEC